MTPAGGDIAYVDSSAIVKLIIRESESAALRRFLRPVPVHASSSLARAEVIRAVRRADVAATRRAFDALAKLLMIHLSASLLDAAGMLAPSWLRSLDAIHLISARTVGARLAAVVTYDERIAEAARVLGLPVEMPS